MKFLSGVPISIRTKDFSDFLLEDNTLVSDSINELDFINYFKKRTLIIKNFIFYDNKFREDKIFNDDENDEENVNYPNLTTGKARSINNSLIRRIILFNLFTLWDKKM